ncbi:PREDICTED: PGC-1 and ERR-induced regulator in muscle protein 1-like [Galeopterus variegatus]|uniref:PGC-1 and ERR-induced regulator in muscle protein 1-like n=1 Tax=Galeopterus variegatus TaxID=482537 RepID=A0ABM0QHS1_GALVR|nr:PREDICTED: PGC-1 and ERR-induced regulator in muscle protein 1-like [Galeopterus variegatus]
MDNFQYSVQLSDQDWAEFSATADECGLLQAGLASGDELLSSDLDQGDSSGSSPPGPAPSLTGQQAPWGRGEQGFKEGDQRVSSSWCEPVLALGAGQQTPSTSALSEAWLSLCSGATPPGQCSPLLGPVSSGDKMQRLLQGSASTQPGEPPRSPESPGCSTTPQRPADSPGASPRSPSRRKKRAVGANWGGRSGAPGPAPAQPGSLLPTMARPEEGLGLAGSRGKCPVAGTAKQMAGTGPDKLESDHAGAPKPGCSPPEQVSIPVPITEHGTDQMRMTPSAELHTASKPVQEVHPGVSMAKPDVALSTPTSEPQPNTALSTPASEPQSQTALSTLASKPRLDVDLPTAGPVVKPEVDPSTPVSMAVPPTVLPHSRSKSDVAVSTPAPRTNTTPSAVPQAGPDMLETEFVVGEPTAEAPGPHSGEPPPGPVQAPKKKKVRFSVAVPTEEPRSGEASGSPSPATARPSAPRTAPGGRRGPGAWDAVAAGPRPPQPRILKHLPPPAPSASVGPGPRSCFAVTLPEAYEFFFCDTIEEDDKGAEAAAADSQAPAEAQWPDMCEFFFQDCGAQRPRHCGGCSRALSPRAEPMPAPSPGGPVLISIPEAYEHFFGEDRFGDVLGPAVFLPPQTSEASKSVSWEQGSGIPSTPGPATAEQLSLAIRQAGELRGPLPSLTFSQKDMCLVFVAFATWAVKTSDLHAPDAWKTVLLANIGTISAIRYFRRQARRGHRSRSPSPSPTPRDCGRGPLGSILSNEQSLH